MPECVATQRPGNRGSVCGISAHYTRWGFLPREIFFCPVVVECGWWPPFPARRKPSAVSPPGERADSSAFRQRQILDVRSDNSCMAPTTSEALARRVRCATFDEPFPCIGHDERAPPIQREGQFMNYPYNTMNVRLRHRSFPKVKGNPSGKVRIMPVG